jgi:hypothetical protein
MWILVNGTLLNLQNVQIIWVPKENDPNYNSNDLIIEYITEEERHFNFPSHDIAVNVLTTIVSIINPKVLS